jgi:hypothetical protein
LFSVLSHDDLLLLTTKKENVPKTTIDVHAIDANVFTLHETPGLAPGSKKMDLLLLLLIHRSFNF